MTQDKDKHIAFFLTGLYAGGGEHVMLTLAREFARDGFRVDVVVMERRGPLGVRLKETENLHVVSLDTSKLTAAVFGLARYMRKEKPDAVVATSEHAHAVVVFAQMLSRTDIRLVARIGIPFSIVFENYTSLRDKLLARLAPLIYRQMDTIIANSKGIADDFARTVGVVRERIAVVYNPIDIEALQQSAEDTSQEVVFKGSPLIVASGRLRYQKGFDILLEAFVELRKEFPDAYLVIIGEGKERKALERIAAEQNIAESVVFPGFLENPYALMARADVFVLPSRWEGFPNVLVEAMALGVPVVAADCPYGPREILAPETGYQKGGATKVEQAKFGLLAPVGDASGLAHALALITQNASLSEHYAGGGSKRARAFSLLEVLPRFKKCLFS